MKCIYLNFSDFGDDHEMLFQLISTHRDDNYIIVCTGSDDIYRENALLIDLYLGYEKLSDREVCFCLCLIFLIRKARGQITLEVFSSGARYDVSASNTVEFDQVFFKLLRELQESNDFDNDLKLLSGLLEVSIDVPDRYASFIRNVVNEYKAIATTKAVFVNETCMFSNAINDTPRSIQRALALSSVREHRANIISLRKNIELFKDYEGDLQKLHSIIDTLCISCREVIERGVNATSELIALLLIMAEIYFYLSRFSNYPCTVKLLFSIRAFETYGTLALFNKELLDLSGDRPTYRSRAISGAGDINNLLISENLDQNFDSAKMQKLIRLRNKSVIGHGYSYFNGSTLHETNANIQGWIDGCIAQQLNLTSLISELRQVLESSPKEVFFEVLRVKYVGSFD